MALMALMGDIIIFIFVIGVVWSFMSSIRSESKDNVTDDFDKDKKNETDTTTGNGIGGTGNTARNDDVKHINTIAEQKEFLEKRYKNKLFEARIVKRENNIRERCPYDDDILFKHDAVINNEFGTKSILKNVKCCDACNRVFVKTFGDGRVQFDKYNNRLYINKRIHDCQRNGHIVVSVTGVVKKIDGRDLNINAQYCATCRKYYIEKEQFDRYRALYGIILGHFAYCDGLNKGYAPLMNQYSLLNLCGYNVNQKDDLSSKTRQAVLKYVIVNKLMSKPDVIKHLDYYINLNGSQSNKKIAVRKWKEDLDYVNNLDMTKQKKINFR